MNFPNDTNRGHPIEGMSKKELTLAEVLQEAGYRTALFGKWHLGGKEGYWPTDQGFDEFFGHLSGGIDAYTHRYVKGRNPPHDLYRNGREVFEDGKYLPDLLVRETNRFLEANKERPFFLYLAFDMVHTPHQPDPEIGKRYQHLSQPRRKYRAYISTLDDRIGKILAALSKKGLRNNTMIIFQSDNGHAYRMGGNAGKWRGAKGSLLEAGIRVPTIISFPYHIPEGEVRDQVITNMDFFPTILRMCNLTLPNRKIDGKDILPVLRSATAPSPHKVLHWQWPIWGSDKQQWAVREGDWKLIVNGLDASRSKLENPFLAHLADDNPEYRNYATDKLDIVDRLTKLHEAWVRAVTQ
jgi:arylsulfatase A-like enzyme